MQQSALRFRVPVRQFDVFAGFLLDDHWFGGSQADEAADSLARSTAALNSVKHWRASILRMFSESGLDKRTDMAALIVDMQELLGS